MAWAWNLTSSERMRALVSLTSLWKGSLLQRSPVERWSSLICLMATVPGLACLTLLTPEIEDDVFLAALVASLFLGLFWVGSLRAMFFVLAILVCSACPCRLQLSPGAPLRPHPAALSRLWQKRLQFYFMQTPPLAPGPESAPAHPG